MQDEVKIYKVVIQNPAIERLIQQTRFLAQVSETAAERLAAVFYKSANSLEMMPERCPWLTDPYIPEHKYRKLVFEKNYMLLFQVIGDSVFVDAVVDCRSEYNWLF